MYVTLVPAYGRDYKSGKAVKEDWKAGKDFQINCIMHPDDGRYINLEDAQGTTDKYSVRFSKLTKTVNV